MSVSCPQMAAALSAFRQTIGALTGNRRLERVLVAYLLAIVAEFGQWIAVIVYAYDRGGAGEAAIVALVQLLPSMLVAPVISARFARIGVSRLISLANLVGATALAASGASIL